MPLLGQIEEIEATAIIRPIGFKEVSRAMLSNELGPLKYFYESGQLAKIKRNIKKAKTRLLGLVTNNKEERSLKRELNVKIKELLRLVEKDQFTANDLEDALADIFSLLN